MGELESWALLLREVPNHASNYELLLWPPTLSLTFVSCSVSWQLRNLGLILLLEKEAFKRKR